MVSGGPGQARELARRAVEAGHRTMVAAGGDGTVNEVLNGIDPAVCTMGILPVGTMNVLASELGIPPGLEEAVALVRSGHSRRLDFGTANGRRFLQLAGAGFDAETVRSTDPATKRMLGPWSYVLTAARLAVAPAPLLRVLPEGHREMRAAMVLVGNGRHYGGPFPFFPLASMSDGLLDVRIFPASGPLDLLRYMHEVVSGGGSSVPYLRVPRVRVEADGGVAFEVDGEFAGESQVDFGIVPLGINVISP